jgi:hypothetical protein
VSVLACPPALCPHVEFALAAQVHTPVSMEWSAQTARPGTLTATIDGKLPEGSAAGITARLRALDPIWFEVVEGPQPRGERFSYTPDLGVYRADLNAIGDIMVSEMRLRDLVDRVAAGPALVEGIGRLLGQAWDEELEPLRRGTDGMAVSLLRRTG